MLTANEMNLAPMPMPEAMPVRSRGTAAVAVLVTGVLVKPRPIPSQSIVLHSSLTGARTRETLRAITAVLSEHRRNSNRQISLPAE